MQPWLRLRPTISPMDRPLQTLVFSFVAWKLLLLVLAASSPGPGYDTSTSLLLDNQALVGMGGQRLPSALQHLVSKLIRWDAIYFVRAANRYYLFEQEWAFGWGFTRLIAFCTAGLKIVGISHYAGLEGIMGIVIAHTSHLLSALVLYHLTVAIFPGSNSTRFGLITALLHVISPAGLFLSAPFAESSCALLGFSGCLLFTKSLSNNGPTTLRQDLLVLLSGISFGIATTFRSNGILSGLLLLEEAFRVLLSIRDGFQFSTVRRLISTGLGGMFVSVGFLLPQYIAYKEYCMDADNPVVRPWCTRSLPSIYTFVQDHYWNVGLFRYWTLSNLPLFLLATPMLVLMVISGRWAVKYEANQQPADDAAAGKTSLKDIAPSQSSRIIRNMAISQLLLALLTATTAHVQIITRISSAYPVSLWYLAASSRSGKEGLVKNTVRFMVIYAIVQGGLFSSFLPPA